MAEEKQQQPAPQTSSADVEFEVLRERASSAFEKYRKVIYAVLAVVIIGGGGYYIYRAFFKAPKELEAKEAVYMAQRYFELDSFQLALDGREGSFDGFVALAEQYGGTSAGHSAYYYAGACFLYTGKYDQALDFLSNYSSSDVNTQAMAYGMMGDAHSELGSMDEALSYYEKAANHAANGAVTPYYLRKAGLLCEHTQKNDQAKAFYERIEKEYPKEADKLGVKKDIIRVSGVY